MSDAMRFDDWEGEHLEHYGVLGMKWGERRYQNQDGSLTPAGERHYAKTGEKGYHYHSHATKKYNRKAHRAETKADIYRGAIKEVRTEHAKTKFNKRLTEKWAKKATKYDAKATKYKNRAKRSAEIDKGEQEYAKSMSTGKAIALTLLGGGDRLKGYSQYRAMAGQKGKNMSGQKVMAAVKAYRSGTLVGSRLAKAGYIRQDEKKGAGQKLYNINKGISNAGASIIDTIAAQNGGFKDRNKKKKRS